jgi:hypothetical protein
VYSGDGGIKTYVVKEHQAIRLPENKSIKRALHANGTNNSTNVTHRANGTNNSTNVTHRANGTKNLSNHTNGTSI